MVRLLAALQLVVIVLFVFLHRRTSKLQKQLTELSRKSQLFESNIRGLQMIVKIINSEMRSTKQRD